MSRNIIANLSMNKCEKARQFISLEIKIGALKTFQYLNFFSENYYVIIKWQIRHQKGPVLSSAHYFYARVIFLDKSSVY